MAEGFVAGLSVGIVAGWTICMLAVRWVSGREKRAGRLIYRRDMEPHG